jgi:hypothetical protein
VEEHAGNLFLEEATNMHLEHLRVMETAAKLKKTRYQKDELSD